MLDQKVYCFTILNWVKLSLKATEKFFNFIKGWHVYGLVQRAYRKYEEAIKCYRNALKFDKVLYAAIMFACLVIEIHGIIISFFCLTGCTVHNYLKLYTIFRRVIGQ